MATTQLTTQGFKENIFNYEKEKDWKYEGLPAIIDFYADWCGPCKMLQHNTFSDADVGTYFNAHFVNVSLDGEKGEGHLLAKKYQVHAYPTMLFIKADGSVKEAAVGYHSPKQLLKIAANIVN